jgi:predicted dehydrogenase/uncharacterized protein YbjT (DUF2867 family)
VVAVLRPRAGDVRYPPGEVVYAHLPYGIPPTTFEGVEAIVHCAGTTTGQDEAESLAVNVETTRVLAAIAHSLPGFRRLIYVSSQSAHEGSVSIYGRTKLRGEEVLRASGVPYAIVRPGLVFGPGSEGLFARMRATVDRLPVLPLLGGGKALVQPIDVEDLCAAFVRCLDLPAGESFEFDLGEPEPMTLADFLQAIAVACRGRRKPVIVVPVAPLALAVRVADAIGVRLPVSKDNVEGVRTVRRMDTRPSLDRLGLELTPFADAMRRAATDTTDTALVGRPVRVVLVGTGKIGIVHALDLCHRPGGALVALVDRKRKAARLYEQMGFAAPFFPELPRAVAALKPDAAIVATPAFTHHEQLRLCLEAGLDVLVEKPLIVRKEQRADFEKLRQAHPDRVIHVGYMATQLPQLDFVHAWLREGAVGQVRAVWGTSLQSHIMAPTPVRWEMRKALAGGGVLTNFTCHLLSILLRLFGMPQDSGAVMWSIHSREVEDAADLHLRYGDFAARVVTSWSASGYARPEMRLVVEGDRGTITVTNAGAELAADGARPALITQRDCDVGFNPSPEYTGAAFACEHENFLAAVRARRQCAESPEQPLPPSATSVGLDEALRLECFIHDLYERFPVYDSPAKVPPPPMHDCSPQCRRLDHIVEGLK